MAVTSTSWASRIASCLIASPIRRAIDRSLHRMGRRRSPISMGSRCMSGIATTPKIRTASSSSRTTAGRLASTIPAGPLSSQNGFTLGMMTNGDYLLADHDLPFSGPQGLKRFIVDFLLSPADLQITDPNGLRTGNFNGQIRSEIPGSHPCYLVPGAYLLPADAPLTRRITGTGAGRYT